MLPKRFVSRESMPPEADESIYMNTFLILLIVALVAQAAPAQSPAPVVTAASGVPAASTNPAQLAPDSSANDAQIRLLEQMKAANEQILSKQNAVLERLEEIEQAAEQLKAFAKRG
jgi:Tfp pilus assembly protein PilN